MDNSLSPWSQFGLNGLVMGALVMVVVYMLRKLVDGMLDQNKTLISSTLGKLDEIKAAINNSRDGQIAALVDLRNDLVDIITARNSNNSNTPAPAATGRERRGTIPPRG
jgi:hypothetical protein